MITRYCVAAANVVALIRAVSNFASHSIQRGLLVSNMTIMDIARVIRAVSIDLLHMVVSHAYRVALITGPAARFSDVHASSDVRSVHCKYWPVEGGDLGDIMVSPDSYLLQRVRFSLELYAPGCN